MATTTSGAGNPNASARKPAAMANTASATCQRCSCLASELRPWNIMIGIVTSGGIAAIQPSVDLVTWGNACDSTVGE